MMAPVPSQLRLLIQKANSVRADFGHTKIADILYISAPSDVLASFDQFVVDARGMWPLLVGPLLAPKVAERLLDGVDSWSLVRSYCSKRLNDDPYTWMTMLDCLLLLFEPENALLWVGENIVSEREPALRFDKDGLTIKLPNQMQFVKEGLLTEKHWIQYARDLPGAGKTDGFVDMLVKVFQAPQVRNFGMAIEPDLIFDRTHHFSIYTREYIYGPKGLSKEKLNSRNFPSDPRGELTVHMRVTQDPMLVRLFPLHRIEVKWSRRDEKKTVEIEELVDVSNVFRCSKGIVSNRYIHSEWDTTVGAITHFDGAVKKYDQALYESRLESNMKDWQGKALDYRKLFRVDSAIELDEWADLVARFFENNELVLEYFENLLPI